MQKLREQFPSVIFSFPDPGKKSDIVNLRGDRVEVDKAYKQLTAMNKELVSINLLRSQLLRSFCLQLFFRRMKLVIFQLESNFQMTVPIFKEFHKHIIGKGGANIRKIREETQTRIDLPAGEIGEDKITVTGKKTNVEKAVEQLTKIQNELVRLETKFVLSYTINLDCMSLTAGNFFSINDECWKTIEINHS